MMTFEQMITYRPCPTPSEFEEAQKLIEKPFNQRTEAEQARIDVLSEKIHDRCIEFESWDCIIRDLAALCAPYPNS